ncbi:MAG: DUF3298 domain-containing protein [Prevotella sp.]|nr:DUF3298 domain-containing protein [Prevotella sp.]
MMIRRSAHIGVFALLIVVMSMTVCCKHGAANKPLLVDSVVVDTSTVVGKNNGAHYHLSLNIKTLADSTYRGLNIALIDSLLTPNIVDLYDTVSISPRERIEQYIKSNFAAYKAFYGTVYAEEPQNGTASTDYNLTTAMEYNDDGIVNYTGTVESVQNGQTTTYTTALNINLEQRRILSLSDVVPNPSDEKFIGDIVKHLCKQVGANDQASLESAGYFTHTPPYAPENFILGSNTITFIYIPGEIADREKGEIRVSISR